MIPWEGTPLKLAEAGWTCGSVVSLGVYRAADASTLGALSTAEHQLRLAAPRLRSHCGSKPRLAQLLGFGLRS